MSRECRSVLAEWSPLSVPDSLGTVSLSAFDPPISISKLTSDMACYVEQPPAFVFFKRFPGNSYSSPPKNHCLDQVFPLFVCPPL